MRGALVAFVAFVVDVTPRGVGACGPPQQFGTHELDPAHGSDTISPAAPTVADVRVHYDTDDGGGGGCGSTPKECSFTPSYLAFEISSTDDATPLDRMGYRIRVVTKSPTAPMLRLPLEGEPIRPPYGGSTIELWFHEDEVAAFTVELAIEAVDLNGNVSATTMLRFEDAGSR